MARQSGATVVDLELAAVLSGFARTMLTNLPLQRPPDELADRVGEVVPVSGAAVTLVSPGLTPQHVAATGPGTIAIERLQTELGEGPGTTAFDTGDAVAVPDLADDARFPRFGPAAVAAGMAAVFAFPLRHGDARLARWPSTGTSSVRWRRTRPRRPRCWPT